jgi:hypothetical protein
MLNSFHLHSFKAWSDTGRVRLAPLTLFFGPNSSGKSSLGHWMLALKRTALSTDRRRALHLGDEQSLLDLGTFEDCLHGHDLTRTLDFSLRWRIPQGLEIYDPLSGQGFRGDEIGMDASLKADPAGQPEARALRYRLFAGLDERLSVSLERQGECQGERQTTGQWELQATGYKLVRTLGKPWPLEPPEKFYRVGEASLARFQNAGFLSDLALAFEAALGRFYYLGPLRDVPRRIYPWAGDAPEYLGMRGQYAVAAILAAQAHRRQLRLGPRRKALSFGELVAHLLKRMGMIADFSVHVSTKLTPSPPRMQGLRQGNDAGRLH